jgi:hypothetical protein
MKSQLEQACDWFFKRAVPENALPIQRTEMRNAFWAGVAALLGILNDDLTQIDEMNEELKNFIQDYKRERPH